jgi:CelD/BcsL family acetyltransferase involved in cellulose biosynthesis
VTSISVTRGAPDADISAHWDDLVARAQANVFMNPDALDAAQAPGLPRIHVLLAWTDDAGHKRLAGIWAFRERRPARLLPRTLFIPPYDYAFVSSPVIDAQLMDEVMCALLDAIERDPALPKVFRAKYLDGDSPTHAALLKALAARGSSALTIAERPRPYASRESGLKPSGSTRKKLRQDGNRLAALGAVDVVNERELAAVREAFEVFLAMEAEGWKGAQGTALLSVEADAVFARRLIGNLAARRNASVALLRLDGRPIAAQVLLYSGDTAYTWKTAFDSRYGKYSPGMLLIEKMTQLLFAMNGIEAVESCSPDGSFMSQLWLGIRPTLDILVDVRSRRSFAFRMAALEARAYEAMRHARNRLRAFVLDRRAAPR